MRSTRLSGPCGRAKWLYTGVCPGGELRPCAQNIVDALKTNEQVPSSLPFNPPPPFIG